MSKRKIYVGIVDDFSKKYSLNGGIFVYLRQPPVSKPIVEASSDKPFHFCRFNRNLALIPSVVLLENFGRTASVELSYDTDERREEYLHFLGCLIVRNEGELDFAPLEQVLDVALHPYWSNLIGRMEDIRTALAKREKELGIRD